MEIFDALTKLYERNNINQKMTFKTQLKNVMLQNSETIQSYFTRVSQIKEQLEVIGDQIEEENWWWLHWMVSQGPGNHSFMESILERG